MKYSGKSLALAASAAAFQLCFAAGSWQPLAHQPSFNACTAELLTDGRVLVQAYNNSTANWVLTPDANGSYVNGTWSQVASMHVTRLYYAGSVLADGRVLLCGGEYSNSGSETNRCEYYDPIANTWTEISPPAGWSEIGDAACMVLPDGKFMLGSIPDNRTAIWNPATGTWTAGPNKFDQLGTEETWTLMPDNTVLCVKCWNHPGSEKYVWPNNVWINMGNVPLDLVDNSSFEVGGGALMPNGQCFHIGANAVSDTYIMPANPLDPGTWVAGPGTPVVNGRSLVAADAPLACLPNGKVLMALGPFVHGGFGSPTYMCEYDGTSIYRVPDPGNSGGFPYNSRMLLLPTGQVLYTTSNSQVWVYTPDGTYDPSWAPSITSCPTTLMPGSDYPVFGRQLNGLTQGDSYGDDAWAPTNYPIVRVTNLRSGHVMYCRTHDHSTMGVATGSAIVSTNFQVPGSPEIGPSVLEVVANGIPSTPYHVNVGTSATLATSFTILRGNYISGDTPDLYSSDDSKLVVSPGSPAAAPGAPLQIQIDSFSPTASPASFQFQLEASVSQGTETQNVELYNFQTFSYELVDSRTATLSDSTISVSPSGNLARFVGPNNAIRARVSYVPSSLMNSLFTGRIDVAAWVIN